MNPRPVVEQAFEAHRARVEATAARITGDPAEAADVASEVFLALLERGTEDVTSLEAWLIASARNRALNRMRSRARGRIAVQRLDLRLEPPPAEPDDPRVRELLDRTMEALSERDRRALVLRYAKEASYEQIAETLQTSPQQARVVVHRAVQRMRRQAVDLLARHHAVPAGCRRVLSKAIGEAVSRGHRSCISCRKVIDELSALGAPGMIAISGAGLVSRALDRAEVGLARITRPHAQLVEAAAVVTLVVSSGLVPAPAVTMAQEPRARAHVASALTQNAGTNLDVAAVSRAARETGGRLAGSVSIDDGEERLAPVPNRVHLIGQTLEIPDGVTALIAPSADIRRFTIGVSARGHALVTRFELAQRPTQKLYAQVAWWPKAGRCSAMMSTLLDDPSHNLLTLTCYNALGVSDEIVTAPLGVSVSGRTVTLRLDRRALPPALAELVRPGAVLNNLRASAWESDRTGVADSAPDDGGTNYTIPRD